MKSSLDLRKTLFWDVDFKKIDYQKETDFIVGRVLDFGNLKEWVAVKTFYGLPKIKKIAQKHIFSDPKSANFWSIMLKIPFKEIKCNKNPFLKTPKVFLKR
jgi:hypothetical protein